MTAYKEEVLDLITDLARREIILHTEDGALKFRAPKNALTEDDRRNIAEHRGELIRILDDLAKPVEHNEKDRYEPFPLTDLQLAYMLGRSNLYDYGSVGCHSYLELELPSTPIEKIRQIWEILVNRHDMLRAVIGKDGTQTVRQHVTMPLIPENDVSAVSPDEQQQVILETRNRMDHRIYTPGTWPMFDLAVTRMTDCTVLHFSIDLMIADFAGIRILISEFGEILKHGTKVLTPLELTFRDIVMFRRSQSGNPFKAVLHERDSAYWEKQLETLPLPPDLPVLPDSARSSAPVRFKRLHTELSPELWQKLSANAASRKLTASSVVLAAFAAVLARWSRNDSFTINLTLFNRPQECTGSENVVGDFIDVDVLGIRNCGEKTFAEKASSLQQRLWEDLEHKNVTGIEVLRRFSQLQGRNILIPVVYTSTLGIHDARNGSDAFIDTVTTRFGITQTPQVWLDCQTTLRYGSLLVDWDIRSGVFPEGMAEDAFSALDQLLRDLACSGEKFDSRTELQLPAAMMQRINSMNSSRTDYVPNFLHEGFYRNVIEQPEHAAVTGSDGSLTYRQLAAQALRISEKLHDAGVQPGDRIALILPKGVRQTAAMLGVLTAGCTCVPVEPDQPEERLGSIIRDARITTAVVAQQLPLPRNFAGGRITVVPADGSAISEKDAEAQSHLVLQQLNTARDRTAEPAYIIFTSGTTGRPKGVMVSHSAAWNTVSAVINNSGACSSDVMLGLASYGFDLSVWDFYGTLSCGAHLVLPDQERRNDPAHWFELIEKHRVTMWNSVPAQLEMLLSWREWDQKTDLGSLRMAFLSGDRIPSVLPDRSRDKLPGMEVISMGGPTETSIWCVWHRITEKTSGRARVTYGRPLPNQEIWILNDRQELCPDFVTGEMYITGKCLAEGYAGNPEKTAESFITGTDGRKYYKSGDLGYYSPENGGVIEIIGREDGQMKINGYRIESGEVESAILRDPRVEQTAVVPADNGKILAAAVVCRAGAAVGEDFTDELRQNLKKFLPGYMVPEQFRIMTELPLSANRKVNRRALSEILSEQDCTHSDHSGQTPRDTPAEQCLAAIWRSLLGRNQIYRDDNFFEIGGSSLTAINLLSQILAHGYPATLELIFNHGRFADMAAELENGLKDEESWLAATDLDEIADRAMKNLDSAAAYRPEESPRNIFVTGVTGYVGLFLLPVLLRRPETRLFCLIRAASAQEGLARIESAAAVRGITLPEDFRDRVRIFCGVMDQDHFGLGGEDYETICTECDTVVHIASIIRLMDPLSAIYPTNVLGVSRILEMATTGRVKQINYISTIAVHYALTDLPEDQAVPENTDVLRWRDVDLTYEKSKIMGENIFYRARQKGVPVNIIRPSSITWDSGCSHPFINDDAFVKFYRSCISMKSYPEARLSINIIPVNYVAEGIAGVVETCQGQSSNFHLSALRSLPVSTVYSTLADLGAPLSSRPFAEWRKDLHDSFVGGFLSLYFKDDLENDEAGHRQYENTQMNRILASRGLSPFTITREYLGLLVANFTEDSK